mgnify:FL=1|tara:strand:+ start:72 stop:317 length:246 start_codon:yes stop_codon:yes gene_type:complete
MTEYSDKVEEQRVLMEAEKWAKGIRYIHANNGVIETKFMNGDIKYNRDGRISWYRAKPTREKLITKFLKWVSDGRGKRNVE